MADEMKFVVFRIEGQWEEAETVPLRGYDVESEAQAFCDVENAKSEAYCRERLAAAIAETEARVAGTDPAIIKEFDRIRNNGKKHEKWQAEERDPRTPLRRLREEWSRPRLNYASYGQPAYYVKAVPFAAAGA